MAYAGGHYDYSDVEEDEELRERAKLDSKPPPAPKWDDDLQRDSKKYFNERAPPVERTDRARLEKGHLPKLVSRTIISFRRLEEHASNPLNFLDPIEGRKRHHDSETLR